MCLIGRMMVSGYTESVVENTVHIYNQERLSETRMEKNWCDHWKAVQYMISGYDIRLTKSSTTWRVSIGERKSK
jgi:hypothetical protein